MSSTNGGTVVLADITPLGAPVVAPLGTISLPATQPSPVAQPGSPAIQEISSNDWRFSANAVLHNNEIYAVQAIDDSSRAAVRLLRIDRTNNGVLENTLISDPSLAFTFPSIAVNEAGDVVIGVTGTSDTEFASSYALVRRAGSPTFEPPRLLAAGASTYVRLDSQNRNRWGDYSATTVDPADPQVIWTNQEFVRAQNNWSTQVSELILLGPHEARWMDPVSGAADDPLMWHTAHGGPPLPTDHVIVSRSPDAGVSYAISFAGAPVHDFQSASIRQGDVVFDIAGNHLNLVSDLDVGPYYGQPHLTVADGSLQSVAGIIAGRPTSAGELTLSNAQWVVAADVVVGSPPAVGGIPQLPGGRGGLGTLSIENNSTLDIGNALTIHEQGTVNLIDGQLRAGTIVSRTALPGSMFGLHMLGGELNVDRFDGVLVNEAGALTPGGDAVGRTEVLADYLQMSAATYEFGIAGPGPGQHDELVVAGTADFDGQLQIDLLGGFTPALADTFEIVQAGFVPVSGLANLLTQSTFPSLGRLLDWHVFYEPSLLTLAVVPQLDGDYNADGVVNAADYVVWRNSNGMFGFGLPADSNLDGAVNLVDYLIWRLNFGQIAPGAGASFPVAVPEPSTIAMLSALAVVAAFRAPRRRKSISLPVRDGGASAG
jgi:hypothetical protein